MWRALCVAAMPLTLPAEAGKGHPSKQSILENPQEVLLSMVQSLLLSAVFSPLSGDQLNTSGNNEGPSEMRQWQTTCDCPLCTSSRPCQGGWIDYMLEVQLLQDRDPLISQPSSRLREAKPPPGHMRHPAGERNRHSVVLGSSGSPERNVDSSSTLLLLIHVLPGVCKQMLKNQVTPGLAR